jgi:DNA sulfur modification protein DndD
MKLRGITLENFGPFYGHNALDLSVAEDAPVVLIHGENMRGKTTLLNAIRWGLYGSSQGMGFRAKETLRYLNYDSLQDGDYHMSVLIEFEHDSHAYGLQRHVQASIKPQYDSDLEQKVELKRDGHFQPAGRIDEIIRGILHPRISRFFLFDGEMMDQFEVLLSTPGRDTELIKESIEQILGLPALQNGMADLHALQRLAES